MFRSFVKSATANAVSWVRLDKLARTNLHRHVPFVACYHRVVERLDACDGFALPAMEISVAMLEQHLDWLARHFRIVSLDDLPTLEQASSSRPLAAVTFDDGYSDVFHHAFPLLKRKGIPAGIFVVTDLVGSTELLVHDRLHAVLVAASRRKSVRKVLEELLWSSQIESGPPERLPKGVQDPFSATRFLLQCLAQSDVRRIIDLLKDEQIWGDWSAALQPVNWEMLTEMRDAGMTIGSHTRTHAFLQNENQQRMLEEVDGSRRELEQRLGAEVSSFAYPGGSFNPNIVDAVAAAGYRYAFTTCRHVNPQHPSLTLPRKVLWQRSCLDPFGQFSSAIMGSQVAGTFDWTLNCKPLHNGNTRESQRMMSASVSP